MKWLISQGLCGIIVCVNLALGLGVAQAQAQSSAPVSDFRFEHLTVNDGLSHSDAESVTQDRAGFIWIGTNRGINRYDGYGLKKYALPINSLNGLSGNRIHALHVGPNGRLWAGTESAGISWYDADHDRFRGLDERHTATAYRPLARQLAQADVVALASDPQGRLWVGTEHQGVFVLSVDAGGYLRRVRRVRLAGSGAVAFAVSSLVATPDGQVWFGTIGSGLRVLASGAGARPLVARRAPLPAAVIQGLHLDRRGDLWVGTSERVFWVARPNRLAGRELAAHPLPQACRQIHDLRLDSFGRLWVGTDYGLYMWAAAPGTGAGPPLQLGPPQLFLPIGGDPLSLQSERVHRLFEDRNQVLWIGASAGGLNKLDLRQKPFGHLQQQLAVQPTLPNNYVNAIYKEEARNLLWIGTRNGFSSYDLARKTYRKLPGLAARKRADGRGGVGDNPGFGMARSG